MELKKNERYLSLNRFLQDKFGERVHKVSVDAGFSCPNRDGNLGVSGCIFCNPASFSPGVRNSNLSIREQVEKEVARMKRRMKTNLFLAYFQPATNTYAPVEELEKKYKEALFAPEIVGLVIGTRPDCVSDDVLDLLSKLNDSTWIHLELGMQSIFDRSLEWFQRKHYFSDFENLVKKAKAKKIHTGAHLILGIPGETLEDVKTTAKVISELGLNSIKIHNLYAATNTKLADEVVAGRVKLISKDEYITMLITFLEHIRPDCVIERLTSESSPDCLIAPQWCLDKNKLLADIRKEFERLDVRQGSKYKCLSQ